MTDRPRGMAALTIHQPWASRIAYGVKMSETRTWKPPARLLGRRIAIHAAAAAIPPDHRVPVFNPRDRVHVPWMRLPTGAILATARLRAAGLIEDHEGFAKARVRWTLSLDEDMPRIFPNCPHGDFTPGRWIWWLDRVKPLRYPIFCPGRQGIWYLTEELAAAVLPAEREAT